MLYVRRSKQESDHTLSQARQSSDQVFSRSKVNVKPKQTFKMMMDFDLRFELLRYCDSFILASLYLFSMIGMIHTVLYVGYAKGPI